MSSQPVEREEMEMAITNTHLFNSEGEPIDSQCNPIGHEHKPSIPSEEQLFGLTFEQMIVTYGLDQLPDHIRNLHRDDLLNAVEHKLPIPWDIYFTRSKYGILNTVFVYIGRLLEKE